MVKSVEERLTTVEHKVEENARRIDGLHEAIRDLGDRMERRFEAVERNMSSRFLWLVGISDDDLDCGRRRHCGRGPGQVTAVALGS